MTKQPPAEPPAHLTGTESADLPAAVKRHRQLGGTCALCGHAVTRRTAARHLALCAPAHDESRGPRQHLVHLRVTAPGLPAYWLDLEARDDARLTALDNVLRRIWLECCGHLSSFDIGAVHYFSPGYDLRESAGLWGPFEPRRIERSMNVTLERSLPALGQRFTHEYDFGSTTQLWIAVTGERVGRLNRTTVRLLARNEAPVWPCGVCGQPATSVCPYCAGAGEQPFACDAHRAAHHCVEPDDEAWLPVVNSPRMGVCGYAG